MKYYVSADVHGFYSEFRKALKLAGYFSDPNPHKLILLGDAFDRGSEAQAMQKFLCELLDRNELILIRGNHEDLYEDLVTADEGLPLRHHVHNGTYDTAIQLTGWDPISARVKHKSFADAARRTPYFQRIIPAAINHFETNHYVFVHGWVPGQRDGYDQNWRHAEPELWKAARWRNGMDAAKARQEPKTIVCGHWHCSYGHSVLEGKGSEFGPDADFSPYYGDGIIALDACTAHSREVNIIVIDD